MIWKKAQTPEALGALLSGSMCSHLGIEFTEVADDHLVATMPVDERTIQPLGVLHGGAAAALVETMGSVAGFLCLEDDDASVAGIAVSCNHVRPASSGLVCGTVRALHVGRTTHVWETTIVDATGRLVSRGTLTLAVVKRFGAPSAASECRA
jgi:uncharacterized protein (TIGR00369 family)